MARHLTTTVPAIDPAADDRELVAAAQGGDRRALDQLLRRHYDRVYTVCRRVLGRDADAADATQDTLIAIVKGLHRFDGQAAFTTWIYRIATNTCFDHLRRQRRRPVTAFDDEAVTLEATNGAEPAFDTSLADRMAIEAALTTLPEEFLRAVVLRDVADLDYADIAITLGVPIGTVRSRIARGRAALARQLGNQPGPPGRPIRADE